MMGIAISLADDRSVIFFVAGAFVVPAIFIVSKAPLTRAPD